MFDKSEKTLSRYFFIIILIATTILFFRMVAPFLVPVLLAAVFATLFYPMYEAFLRLFRGRRTLAAFLCCLILFLGMILPLYGVAHLVTREAIDVYHTAQQKVAEMIRLGEAGPLGRIKSSRWVQQFQLDQINWRESLQNAAATAGTFVAGLINRTSRGTLQLVVVMFVTLFTMFYFFRDGRVLLRRVRYLIPMDRESKNAIAARFTAVSRATVRGTLLISLAQGALATLTMWIFGVDSPFLWGVVATLFAIIPMVGAWLVLYPAAFIQMAVGNLWQGIGILIVTIVVIVNVDNIMRPRLVGHEAGMHDLMVFFSTLGGIGMFGAAGFIIGPMIAALFLSLLDIYSREFKDDLDGTLTLADVPMVVEEDPPAVREGGAA